MQRLLFVLLLSTVSSKVFDVCPERRASIGLCLVGLCPAGSECISNYCCKFATANVSQPASTHSEEESTTTEATDEDDFGTCLDGSASIGECVSGACPDGHTCEEDKCCKATIPPEEKRSTTRLPVKTTMVPSSRPIVKETTTTTTRRPTPTTWAVSEWEEERPEVEESDIEEMKREYNLLKKSTTFSTQRPTTTTTEVEVVEVEEEKETTTTEESTTAAEEMTTTERVTTTRPKKRRPTPTTSTTTISYPETAEPDYETTDSEIDETTTEGFTWTTTVEPSSTTEYPEGTCPVGEPIGECVSSQCPEGHVCHNAACCILTPQINCTDTLAGCKLSMCERRGYSEFMTRSCAKTCAKCHLMKEKIAPGEECRDRRADCNEWAAEGFCHSTLYTTRQKMKFCGKSCKLC